MRPGRCPASGLTAGGQSSAERGMAQGRPWDVGRRGMNREAREVQGPSGPEQPEEAAGRIINEFGRELGRIREKHGNPSYADMAQRIRHVAGVAGSKNTFN